MSKTCHSSSSIVEGKHPKLCLNWQSALHCKFIMVVLLLTFVHGWNTRIQNRTYIEMPCCLCSRSFQIYTELWTNGFIPISWKSGGDWWVVSEVRSWHVSKLVRSTAGTLMSLKGSYLLHNYQYVNSNAYIFLRTVQSPCDRQCPLKTKEVTRKRLNSLYVIFAYGYSTSFPPFTYYHHH